MSRLTEQQAKQVLFSAQMAGYPNKKIPELLTPLYSYIEQMQEDNAALREINGLQQDSIEVLTAQNDTLQGEYKDCFNALVDCQVQSARLRDELIKTIEHCAPDHSEIAGYKEEVDLQRDSIQRLSAQVAELRGAATEYLYTMSDSKAGITVEIDAKRRLTEILNSPDPGAEIRGRMAKLEAVAKAAKEVLNSKLDNDGWLQICASLQKALAALEGGRP